MRLEVRMPSILDGEVRDLRGLPLKDGQNSEVLRQITGIDIELYYYHTKDTPAGLILFVRDAKGTVRDRCILRIGPAGKLRLERRMSPVDVDVETPEE